MGLSVGLGLGLALALQHGVGARETRSGEKTGEEPGQRLACAGSTGVGGVTGASILTKAEAEIYAGMCVLGLVRIDSDGGESVRIIELRVVEDRPQSIGDPVRGVLVRLVGPEQLVELAQVVELGVGLRGELGIDDAEDEGEGDATDAERASGKLGAMREAVVVIVWFGGGGGDIQNRGQPS